MVEDYYEICQRYEGVKKHSLLVSMNLGFWIIRTHQPISQPEAQNEPQALYQFHSCPQVVLAKGV